MTQTPRRIQGSSGSTPERRLVYRWSSLCAARDLLTVLAESGLTPAGSPPSVMERVYAEGAREREDAGGYDADEPPAEPDPELEQVTEFMEWMAALRPGWYRAGLARHRRLVDGRRHPLAHEYILAMLLYGGSRPAAHQRLAEDCEALYAALRRWLRVWRDREGYGFQK